MFSPLSYVLLWTFPILITSGILALDTHPYLTLYSPGEPEYTDVLVKRVGDNLTLVCELKGDVAPRVYFWNYLPNDNVTGGDRPLTPEQRGLSFSSRLWRVSLRLNDSGHYVCSSPPFSVSKFILVQTRGPRQCTLGAFWCGKHCVLASYVCDGFKDCMHGEDEAPELCMQQPCARPDKLNCSSGRCISSAACCRPGTASALCKQPDCCDEHPPYSRVEAGYVEVEYPPLFEDRHAPDEYGFIQSTIYTVTACALIFMIAVVLLVSAICKMHMKRAALREYTHSDRATRLHYQHHYQTHRFPPCYEASRLLEQQRTSPTVSQQGSPSRAPLQCTTECEDDQQESTEQQPRDPIARFTNMFTRYRQVPTQCLDVEMTDVRSASCNTSPTRNRTGNNLDNYRSPTYCDLNSELFFNQEISNCGRDLNYMATPLEFYRRRTLRNNLERVIDQINRPRPITLQLGRFQLSIPRLGRRQSLDRRPDTPNVAELNINDMDIVRLNSNDTYTLNGRTIRLLGANFENYPVLESNGRPPPYNEAMRYKLFGPPPEYLSRDALNTERDDNIQVSEEQARQNIEMPPNYEDLNSSNNNVVTVVAVTENVGNGTVTENVTSNVTVTDNVTSNGTVTENVGNRTVTENVTSNVTVTDEQNGNESNVTANFTESTVITATEVPVTNVTATGVPFTNVTATETQENIRSVIDNLPAIDSDVNANETEVRYNVICNVASNNNGC